MTQSPLLAVMERGEFRRKIRTARPTVISKLTHYPRGLSSDEIVSFVFPAPGAANHFLDEASETRQPDSRSIRSITMRSVAINDEDHLRRVLFEIPFVDSSMGQVDRLGKMARRERLGTADIQKDEAASRIVEFRVDIPAI